LNVALGVVFFLSGFAALLFESVAMAHPRRAEC
jgi:hypothetical protein